MALKVPGLQSGLSLFGAPSPVLLLLGGAGQARSLLLGAWKTLHPSRGPVAVGGLCQEHTRDQREFTYPFSSWGAPPPRLSLHHGGRRLLVGAGRATGKGITSRPRVAFPRCLCLIGTFLLAAGFPPGHVGEVLVRVLCAVSESGCLKIIYLAVHFKDFYLYERQKESKREHEQGEEERQKQASR